MFYGFAKRRTWGISWGRNRTTKTTRPTCAENEPRPNDQSRAYTNLGGLEGIKCAARHVEVGEDCDGDDHDENDRRDYDRQPGPAPPSIMDFEEGGGLWTTATVATRRNTYADGTLLSHRSLPSAPASTLSSPSPRRLSSVPTVVPAAATASATVSFVLSSLRSRRSSRRSSRSRARPRSPRSKQVKLSAFFGSLSWGEINKYGCARLTVSLLRCSIGKRGLHSIAMP